MVNWRWSSLTIACGGVKPPTAFSRSRSAIFGVSRSSWPLVAYLGLKNYTRSQGNVLIVLSHGPDY